MLIADLRASGSSHGCDISILVPSVPWVPQLQRMSLGSPSLSHLSPGPTTPSTVVGSNRAALYTPPSPTVSLDFETGKPKRFKGLFATPLGRANKDKNKLLTATPIFKRYHINLRCRVFSRSFLRHRIRNWRLDRAVLSRWGSRIPPHVRIPFQLSYWLLSVGSNYLTHHGSFIPFYESKHGDSHYYRWIVWMWVVWSVVQSINTFR